MENLFVSTRGHSPTRPIRHRWCVGCRQTGFHRNTLSLGINHLPSLTFGAQAHTELVALVESTRSVVARRVNALTSAVYREIGWRIVETEQGGNERTDYGEGLIERLVEDLGAQFGRDSVPPIGGRCAPFIWPGHLSEFSRHCLLTLPDNTMARPPVRLSWPKSSPCPGPAMPDC